MNVIYVKPNEDDYIYTRWFDENGTFDIWYESQTSLFRYEKSNIPTELKEFLDKWSLKFSELKKTYVELYPVKLAKIEFIYKDVIYSLYPSNVKATYKTNFMSDEEYEVSWDSLFELYQRDIRNDLKKELGVIYSRYWGMLD